LLSLIITYHFDGRGSALYIKDSIQSNEFTMPDTCDASVWCTLTLKNQDRLIVGLVYRSPNSSESQNKHLLERMDYVLEQNYSHVLIMGDFNYPEINWNMDISTASADHPSQVFITRYRNWFLHQHVTEPIRTSEDCSKLTFWILL